MLIYDIVHDNPVHAEVAIKRAYHPWKLFSRRSARVPFGVKISFERGIDTIGWRPR
jgi:hypothetical protein